MAETRNFQKPDYQRLFACIFAFTFLSVCIYVQLLHGNSGDKNWRLLATSLWLEGRPLYSGTFVDVNLPLIVWLFSIPTWIAQRLSLVDYHALSLFGLGLAAYAMFLSMKLIGLHPELQSGSRRYQFLALLFFITICYPSPSIFFEREYIFAVMTLPYLLRWMPTLAGTRLPLSLRLQTGALAALGFLMKPHCILLFAGIQLLFILQQKSLRILVSAENAVIYLLAIVYGCALAWLTPDYFAVILPMAMATYGAQGNFMIGMFCMAIAGFTFALAIVDFRFRYTSPYRRDIYYLLGLLPFLVAYIIYNNGWATTYYPLMSLLFLLAAMLRWEALWLQAEYKGNPVSKTFVFAARACTIAFALNIILVATAIYQMFSYRCADHIECSVDHMLMKEVQKPDGGVRSYGTMCSVFSRWIDLNRNTGAKLETRFAHLWMMTKFESSPPEFYAPHEWILHYVADAYAQDLSKRKPDVMFVDAHDLLKSGPDGKEVTIPVYLSRYEDFKAAWSAYRYSHKVDFCPPHVMFKEGCNFDVYERARP